jgi:RNA polymerase sigma factor (TIGR02999 family)
MATNTPETPRPPGDQQHPLTMLLEKVSRGEAQATDELFPMVYDELRALASASLAQERKAHTLQATALVHEAYMRLVGPSEVSWESRAHFFGAAARAIRRILTDHARARNAVKRGGGRPVAELAESAEVAGAGGHGASGDVGGTDFVALDAALEKLAAIDPERARVVELRFFAGLSVDQTAAALGSSPRTVARQWEFARAWLKREMESGAGGATA